MHFEILVEDSSGTRLLEHLLPKLIGPRDAPHAWRLHPYRGISRIPKNLVKEPFPAHRDLLLQLPRLLRGYARTPGYDAVVVVCDTDKRDCAEFLAALRNVAKATGAEPITMFRLAIEEMESWYLGDPKALFAAYPAAKKGLYEAYNSGLNVWNLGTLGRYYRARRFPSDPKRRSIRSGRRKAQMGEGYRSPDGPRP